MWTDQYVDLNGSWRLLCLPKPKPVPESLFSGSAWATTDKVYVRVPTYLGFNRGVGLLSFSFDRCRLRSFSRSFIHGIFSFSLDFWRFRRFRYFILCFIRCFIRCLGETRQVFSDLTEKCKIRLYNTVRITFSSGNCHLHVDPPRIHNRHT